MPDNGPGIAQDDGRRKPGHVNPTCDEDGCYCPDDVFWGRLLGDDDPCAPGKDWVAAAFTEGPIEL